MGPTSSKLSAMEEKKNIQEPAEFKKAKLIYSIELLVFAIVFLVLGILKILGIIAYNANRQTYFTYITLAGGFITLGDLIWLLCSPRRRAKNSLLDKLLPIPLSLTLITMDIIALVTPNLPTIYFISEIGTAFLYLSAVYFFEGIFHYFYPVPALFDAEAKAEAIDQKAVEAPKEESKDEAKINDGKK
jgi:hypothetical protein